jgi:phosphoglycerate kinase
MTQNQGRSLITSIRDMDLHGKRVFLRLDLNVPLAKNLDTGKMEITEANRILEALPTIELAIKKGGKVVIASHLGRPDGKRNPEFSLEPVAAFLAEKLESQVTLADDCIGEGIELMIHQMPKGSLIVLENLRFHKEEEKNDPEFCRKLASLCDVYVNDAFGTCHRKHASVYGLPEIVPLKGMGLLIEKELHYLEPLIKNPLKPFYAILGGSKVTDKIKTIQFLLSQVDGLCIGGAMAHAFWIAEGKALPETAKKPKPEDVQAAKQILSNAKKKELPIFIPIDTNQGFDIGPKTVALFAEKLSKAKTIFWNGPMGWFENPDYTAGTYDLAKACAEFQAIKIVGGGDTVSAIQKSGYAQGFQHLSTGGGAVLEFLEGSGLPGIEILKSKDRPISSPPFKL